MATVSVLICTWFSLYNIGFQLIFIMTDEKISLSEKLTFAKLRFVVESNRSYLTILYVIVFSACFRSFASSLNTNAPGGRLTTATTVTDCQTACLMYTKCTGIDWYLNFPVGSQCYLTGTWSPTLNTGNAPGVIHYEIVSSGMCQGINSRSGKM